jgi:transposase-like protein
MAGGTMKTRPSAPGTYTEEFKNRVVQRYLSGSESSSEVAATEGIRAGTLRHWALQRQADAVKKNKPIAQPVDERSAQEKLRLLFAAKGLPDSELGEFLRREGLREGDLERWEQEATDGLKPAAAGQATERQLREMEKRLHKTEKRLREAEALLDLQKKVQALWGAADDDTKAH